MPPKTRFWKKIKVLYTRSTTNYCQNYTCNGNFCLTPKKFRRVWVKEARYSETVSAKKRYTSIVVRVWCVISSVLSRLILGKAKTPTLHPAIAYLVGYIPPNQHKACYCSKGGRGRSPNTHATDSIGRIHGLIFCFAMSPSYLLIRSHNSDPGLHHNRFSPLPSPLRLVPFIFF